MRNAVCLMMGLIALYGSGNFSAQANVAAPTLHSAGILICPNINGSRLEIELNEGWTEAVSRKWNDNEFHGENACDAKNFGIFRNIFKLSCIARDQYGESFESSISFSNYFEKSNVTARFKTVNSSHRSRGPFYMGLNKPDYITKTIPVDCTFSPF